MEKIPCIKCNPNMWNYIRPYLEEWGYYKASNEDMNFTKHEILIINTWGVFGGYSANDPAAIRVFNRELMDDVHKFLDRAATLMGKKYIWPDQNDQKIPCIKCTRESYNNITDQLTKIGYSIGRSVQIIESIDVCPFLVINADGILGACTLVGNEGLKCHNRELVNDQDEFISKAKQLMSNKLQADKDENMFMKENITPGMLVKICGCGIENEDLFLVLRTGVDGKIVFANDVRIIYLDEFDSNLECSKKDIYIRNIYEPWAKNMSLTEYMKGYGLKTVWKKNTVSITKEDIANKFGISKYSIVIK